MAIQFNGANKLITLNSNSLNVNTLWSEWVDWLLISDNSKYPIAFNQVGGNSIDESAGTSIPLYYFLLNGWKIKPQESNHTLSVTDGILLVLGGGDPFVNTIGNYMVRINYQQPVQAITVSTGGGGNLTKQQIRDALALSLSDGTDILLDSVDNILNRLDLKTNYI
jgi:hypothetical protein